VNPEDHLGAIHAGELSRRFYGYGWDIPIPYIVRMNKNGVDELYDSDTYFYSSLSGQLATTSSSTVYQTRFDDGSFMQYEYIDNAWTVTDKAGVVYKFGHSTTTRQDNATNTSEVYKWMLEEVRDKNDNYVSYEYYKDGGEIYPDTITYTGHDTTDGPFTVEFVREARDDIDTSSDPNLVL